MVGVPLPLSNKMHGYATFAPFEIEILIRPLQENSYLPPTCRFSSHMVIHYYCQFNILFIIYLVMHSSTSLAFKRLI